MFFLAVALTSSALIIERTEVGKAFLIALKKFIKKKLFKKLYKRTKKYKTRVIDSDEHKGLKNDF